MKLEYRGESCNNHDSDDDGYVSCSYSDANGEIRTVECAAAFNMQHGCRAPKTTIKVHNHVHNSR